MIETLFINPSIDWQILILGAVLGAIMSGVFSLFQGLVKSYITSKNPTYKLIKNIKGVWYSAEYDLKDILPKSTIIKVYLKYSSFSNKVKIKLRDKRVKISDPKSTGWIVTGKLLNDTLIGEWNSVIEGTKRYGTVILKFLVNSRAVGYWTGYSGIDSNPKYGYWIMDKNESILNDISNSLMKDYNFKFYNVGFLVENFEQRERLKIQSIEV